MHLYAQTIGGRQDPGARAAESVEEERCIEKCNAFSLERPYRCQNGVSSIGRVLTGMTSLSTVRTATPVPDPR